MFTEQIVLLRWPQNGLFMCLNDPGVTPRPLISPDACVCVQYSSAHFGLRI